jgi:hypothetical protein
VTSIKQFTQLAGGAVQVWKIFEPSAPQQSIAHADDPKQRAEQSARRLRNLCEDLKARLGQILDLEGANDLLKARMIVDALVCLESSDVRNVLDKEHKARVAQLSRDYQSAFDTLRQNLGESGIKLLWEIFHFPSKMAGLAEFVKLRRDSSGMESREVGLKSRLEACRAELADAKRHHFCMEAVLRKERAKKVLMVGLGCTLFAFGSVESSRILGVALGGVALLLLAGGLISWTAGAAAMAGVGEEVRLKVSSLDESGFLAVGERLRKAEEESSSIEKRLESHREELNAISDRISACVELEPTWRVMSDAELTELMQRMTSRCRESLGEDGAIAVFRNLRELSRL